MIIDYSTTAPNRSFPSPPSAHGRKSSDCNYRTIESIEKLLTASWEPANSRDRLFTYRSVDISTTADQAPHRDEGSVKLRILVAARRAFAKGGYAGASLQQVAAAAATTKPMIHYYFGSKEGLYRAVVEVALQRAAERLHKAVQPSRELRAQLGDVARSYLTATGEDRECLELLQHAEPQQLTAVLRAVLPPLNHSHAPDSRESDLVATLLFGALFAAARVGPASTLTPDSVDLLTTHADDIVALLWAGLGRKHASRGSSQSSC